MVSTLKKYLLSIGRILIVFFLLVNLLLPNVTAIFIEIFPLLKNTSTLSISLEKWDIDQEDEKEIEGDKENEKEIDEDFFVQIDQVILTMSWALNYCAKDFSERSYPNQIFPITTPPPRSI